MPKSTINVRCYSDNYETHDIFVPVAVSNWFLPIDSSVLPVFVLSFFVVSSSLSTSDSVTLRPTLSKGLCTPLRLCTPFLFFHTPPFLS